MRRLLLPFVFAATLPWSGCTTPGPTPPTPGAGCSDVCARAAALGCRWAQSTPKGASCNDVCENLRTSGLPSWNLDCRVNAASCAAMDSCE